MICYSCCFGHALKDSALVGSGLIVLGDDVHPRLTRVTPEGSHIFSQYDTIQCGQQ